LPAASPSADAARATAYANWLAEHLTPGRTVLEIGCGSGALLSELSHRWPNVRCVGIDPALPPTTRSQANLRFERGSFAEAPENTLEFDLIIAVNVIEHVPAPAAFFASLRDRLATGGQIALVYPAADPPNVELMFYDHLHSLSAPAISAAARSEGFAAIETARAPSRIDDFELTVFATGKPGTESPATPRFAELAAARQVYMRKRADLDSILATRMQSASNIIAFGAGQMAALIRTYAPSTWERVNALVIDESSEAWNLHKPVQSYDTALPLLKGASVLIATSPRVQRHICGRLTRDGFHPIRFDDIVLR